MLCGLLQGLPKLGVPHLGSVAERSRFLGKSGGQRRGWGLGLAPPLFSASCFSPSCCDSPSPAGFLGQEENCSLKSGASKFRKQDTGLGCGRGLGGLRGMWQHPSGWVGGRNGHLGPLAALSSFHWGNLLIFPSPAALRPRHVPWRAAALQRGVGRLLSLYFTGYWANAGGGRAAGLCHLCVPPWLISLPITPTHQKFRIFFGIF